MAIRRMVEGVHKLTKMLNQAQARQLKSVLALIFITALVWATAPFRATAQTDVGLLRFVHAIPKAEEVNIFVDGTIAASKLEYATATRFIKVPIGDHQVSVVASSTNTELVKANVTLAPNQARTVVIDGTAAATLNVYDDDLGPASTEKMRITAIHAVAGGPKVDIIQVKNNELLPVINGLEYGQAYGSLDLPAIAADWNVVVSGQVDKVLTTLPAASLAAGTNNVLVVIGAADSSTPIQVVVLSAALASADPANSGLVRFVHANPDLPSVDVYAGSTLIIPNFKFGQFTPHLALPAGALDLTLRPADSTPNSVPTLSATVTVAIGEASTVIVAGLVDKANVIVGQDNIAALDSKVGRITFFNATGAGTATFNARASVTTTDISTPEVPPQLTLTAMNDGSSTGELAAGIYSFDVSVDEPALTTTGVMPVNGGVLYDVIVAGSATQPLMIVAATGLNETLGSDAWANQKGVSAPAATTEAPAATVEVGAATLTMDQMVQTAVAATIAASNNGAPVAPPPTDGSGTIIVTATPDSQTAATAVPTLSGSDIVIATATPFTDTANANKGIFGTVDTNPGVNLKLREYPREDALTLALAPSQTVLTIIGVQGPASPTVEGTADVTQVPTPTLSAEGILIDQIWVFVRWPMADGGEITGWTKAMFLRITRDGRSIATPQEILAFDQVPANTFGKISTTLVTPVAGGVTPVLGIVVVDPGVRLQVRRTPTIQGESLILLDNGAQVIVLMRIEVEPLNVVGEPKNNNWLLVRYETSTGAVTGWVNSDFIVLTRFGQPYLLENLPKADEKNIPVGSTTGSIVMLPTAGAPGLVATVDKVEPGANLQLRRNPNAQAESLGLIPLGTIVPVKGRNGDGNWLFVDYNGTQGWVASIFVSVTRDGRRVRIVDLPNVTEEPDIAASITPGPSPTPTAVPA